MATLVATCLVEHKEWEQFMLIVEENGCLYSGIPSCMNTAKWSGSTIKCVACEECTTMMPPMD